jgi:beta-fructofuranosidase
MQEEMMQNARKLRDILLKDPFRPQYHVVSPEGSAPPCDPNGAIFWKGRYHLMYIIKTEKGFCWAHVSSIDLVHWKHHPMALEPDELDKIIFSGGASLDKNGVPTITYWSLRNWTGHAEPADGGVCLATSTDDNLDHWTKSPHNPVIQENIHGAVKTTGPDGKELIYGAADPSAIWIHNGRHYMLTGNLLVLHPFGLKQNMAEHKGDTAYLFVSDDLVHWQYLHPFYTSDRKWTAEDEDDMCPDFFPLGDRHVLLFISHNRGCQYYIGRYENDHFYPETHGRMTWADNGFFAPESLVDDTGRRIMWAWIPEKWDHKTHESAAWYGTMSLPRVLWLAEDRTLRMAPPAELACLRYNPRKIRNLKLKADADRPLPQVRGNCIELNIEMSADTAAQFGVKVCCSPDGREQTSIYYDAKEKKLVVDVSQSTIGEHHKQSDGGPFELAPGEPLKLRVFVDRSVVEVFANDRQAVMRRIHPILPDSVGVSLFSRGGPAKVRFVEAWDLDSSNPW